MSRAESFWADIQKELGRKSLEVLHQAVHDHEEGTLTDRELVLIINTLFDTISGLAPQEITDVVYSVRKELEREKGRYV